MIEYIVTDEKDINFIESLWKKLNRHHEAKSNHFKGKYQAFTFEKRSKELLCKAQQGCLRIELAKDRESDAYIGYCVSSVVDEIGEIESIYIEENHRGNGVGATLMENAIRWMDGKNVIQKKIQVAGGNEEALAFYERYGFVISAYVLTQK